MTKEDKELLLNDLSARLPYKPMCSFYDDETKYSQKGKLKEISINRFHGWAIDVIDVIGDGENGTRLVWSLENVKPYLRPMSSMTEEEKSELWQILSGGRTNLDLNSSGQLTTEEEVILGINYPFVCPELCKTYIDWLNKNQFDYRGLIPRGLALEAPKGMYK